jgi:hypothetical protein
MMMFTEAQFTRAQESLKSQKMESFTALFDYKEPEVLVETNEPKPDIPSRPPPQRTTASQIEPEGEEDHPDDHVVVEEIVVSRSRRSSLGTPKVEKEDWPMAIPKHEDEEDHHDDEEKVDNTEDTMKRIEELLLLEEEAERFQAALREKIKEENDRLEKERLEQEEKARQEEEEQQRQQEAARVEEEKRIEERKRAEEQVYN